MTDKKYKVIVSDRAKRMLGAHIRFIAQVNKDAASTKKKEIIAAIRSLNHMPQRFPFFEEAYIPPNKYHKMFIEKWYLVLYQIQDDTLFRRSAAASPDGPEPITATFFPVRTFGGFAFAYPISYAFSIIAYSLLFDATAS